MSKPDDEPFLARWARRKREAAQPAATPATAPGATGDGSAQHPPSDAPQGEIAAHRHGRQDEEEPLDLETLPRIDELTAESDITAFLDKRVPAILRNAALSRMWSLDPTIRDFVEVAENQWNWNVPGGAPFYEEMLPGSSASTLIADATSAIARSLPGPTTEPDTLAAADPLEREVAATENVGFQQYEKSPTELDATHEDHATDQVASPVEPTTETPIIAASSAPPVEPSAISEPYAAPQPYRRRHGGALPS